METLTVFGIVLGAVGIGWGIGWFLQEHADKKRKAQFSGGLRSQEDRIKDLYKE